MTMLMSRSRLALVPATATIALVALTDVAAAQVTAEQQSAIRASCRSDFMSKCSGVTPGGKDALVCLQTNVASLSPACQTAVSATMPAPTKPVQAAPAPAPPAAATAAPPAPAVSAAPEKPAAAATAAPVVSAPPPPAKPATAAKPVKQPAAPTPAAPSPPAQAAIAPPPAEPVVPLAKIEAMPLPTRLAVIRSCRYDQDAVCRSVKTGEERVIACLAAHTSALSPPCRTALQNALR